MATEKEILQRAKMYIDKLAKGINPITDDPVTESDAVNDIKVARCLFYVSGILEEKINSLTYPLVRNKDKADFSLSIEKRNSFPFSSQGVYLSQIVDILNNMIDTNSMKKLKSTSAAKFLVDINFLEIIKTYNGKNAKRPTNIGRENGIYTETRKNKDGFEYLAVYYSIEAQRFIIDNLDAIIEINSKPSEKRQKKIPPLWTMENTQVLIQLFDAGATVEEIADSMDISRNEASSMINSLGLWSPNK